MAGNSATLATIETAFKGRVGAPTGGVASFSGNGATTVFNIAHGQAAAPNSYHALPVTEAATAKRVVTVTATNIVITYAVAPANLAALKFRWRASRLV